MVFEDGLKSFDLVRSIKVFKHNVKLSYYYKSNKERDVKCRAINVFSHKDELGNDVFMRKRLIFETGELVDFSRQDCLNSLRASTSRTWFKISDLLDANDFDWFVTLTFDNKRVDRYDDAVVYDCYKKWIRNVKKACPAVRYITVVERHELKEKETELGKDKGVIHFHLLMGDISARELTLVDSGKVSCSWLSDGYSVCSLVYFNKTKNMHELKETDGLPVYNMRNFLFGLSTVTRVISQDKTKSYVKKYLEKDLGSTTIFKKNYFYSSNLEKPLQSKDIVKKDMLYIKSLSCADYEDIYTQTAVRDYYSYDYKVRQLVLDKQEYDFAKNLGLVPVREKVNVFDCNKNVSIDEIV